MKFPLPLLVLGLLAAGLPACRTAPVPHAPLPVVEKVDLNRYAGRWFEVSRLPNFFQQSCVRSTAVYTLLPDGKGVAVRNTCYKTRARQSSVEGTAVPVPDSGNAKLKVKFRGLASLAPVPEEGNYWILDLDPQYRWAMVGTPDRKYLWMLARQPQLPFDVYSRLKTKARSLGFNTDQLIPEDTIPSSIAETTPAPDSAKTP